MSHFNCAILSHLAHLSFRRTFFPHQYNSLKSLDLDRFHLCSGDLARLLHRNFLNVPKGDHKITPRNRPDSPITPSIHESTHPSLERFFCPEMFLPKRPTT